jgi:hypothetical protein
MSVNRKQMSRNAHRIGFGRVNYRLRRNGMVALPPAPIGHNAMPKGDSEPEWLKERPMSDEWNNNQQTNDYHQPNQYQPHQEQSWGNHQGDQQTFQPQSDFQPQPEHQHFEPTHEPVIHAPSAELVRLDAVEAAIQELRTHINEMKASLHAQTEAKITPEPEPVEAPVATEAHADRLALIEAEIGSVKTHVIELAQAMADIHADVKSNAALHDETRGIVDEQHQLMRGLNYIITSAIGTLTASAKTVK